MEKRGGAGDLYAHQPKGNPELPRSNALTAKQQSTHSTPRHHSIEVQQAVHKPAEVVDVPPIGSQHTVPRMAPTPQWQPRPPLVTVQRRLVFDDLCSNAHEGALGRNKECGGRSIAPDKAQQHSTEARVYQDMQRYVGALPAQPAPAGAAQPTQGATPCPPASKKQRTKTVKPLRQPLGTLDINVDSGAQPLPYKLRARRRIGRN